MGTLRLRGISTRLVCHALIVHLNTNALFVVRETMRRGRKQSVAECFLSRKRADEPSSDEKFPVTLQTTDEKLQHQSPAAGQDGDRTTISSLESRSTSDHMATTVSRSLPDGICQGHRPMPDQLATAKR